MGDDLEDDYVQGGDEYLSEGEDDLSFSGAHGDADVEGEGIVPDAEGGSPAPVAGGKRKAGEEDVASDSDDDDGTEAKPSAGRELTEAERKKEKKRRNKEKLKEKKVRPLTAFLIPVPSRQLKDSSRALWTEGLASSLHAGRES